MKAFLPPAAILCLVCIIAIFSPVRADDAAPRGNPFFAMDTSYRRPGLSRQQQLDLVKQLGFSGVTEDIRPADQTKAQLAEIETRGLKLFALYAGATATADGKISTPGDLPAVMDALKNHNVIIWLHIGGKGPATDSLNEQTPMIIELRRLSDTARADGVRLAIYPHFGEYTAHLADAIKLAKVVNRDNFGVTFNLCHNLANGDEKQIPDLISSAGDKLFIATINGADANVKGADWSKLIQPLGSGNYDVKIVLNALAKIHFAGPIGFQGYGINRDARAILEPTMEAWKAEKDERK